MIGLEECERHLAQPLPSNQLDEWTKRKDNILQALEAISQSDSGQAPDIPCDRQKRNAMMFKFVDEGKAEEFRRAHG